MHRRPAPAATQAHPEREVVERTSAALRVLIVDDNPAVAQLLARVLEHTCVTELAENAAEARALLGAQPFDAILSDYELVTETSEALLAHVRDLYPRMRRVLCSGSGEVAARVLELGLAHAAVAKPLASTADLLAALGLR